MKQGKLLILLAAILSLTMLAAACTNVGDTSADTSDGTSTDTSVSTSDSTSDDTTDGTDGDGTESVAGEEEQEPETDAAHELHDWFILKEEDELKNLSNVTRLEGEIVEADFEHNLIVVQNLDLDKYNNVVKKLTVINVLTGEKLAEAEATYPLNTPVEEDQVTLSVDIRYPVIQITKFYYVDDKAVYDADYYLAKADKNNCIHSMDQADPALVPADFSVNSVQNGLVKATMSDKVMWIDKDLNVVRTADAIVENGYANSFDAEYQGCLYTFDDEDTGNICTVRVFNRQGLCSAEYSCKDLKDTRLFAHVLDNGNVLIQQETKVDEYTVCDYTIEGDRYTIKSMILDFDNGTLTEIDLDFVVRGLATKYAQNRDHNSFPFDLVAGKENQAYIYRFVNGSINTYPEYVVMSNELKVEYSVKNPTRGVNLSTIRVIDNRHYSALVDSGLVSGRYVFDLDGNIVSYNVSATNVGNYRVTYDGYVYNAEGKLVYDANANGYVYERSTADRFYLSKVNYVTGGTETYYVMYKDLASGNVTPVLLADGVEQSVPYMDDDVYVLYDEEAETYTVCATDGTELLVTSRLTSVEAYEDYVVIGTVFDGKDLIYVLTEKNVEINVPETEPETTEETASAAN